MHSPSAHGGHPLYVQELMTALVRHPLGGKRFEWLTSQDIDPAFRSDAYPLHAILPRLAHKSQFPNRLAWAIDRIRHYPRCDRLFLKWLARRPDITAVHFQEFSQSQAWLFSQIRKLNKKIVYTVHNIRPHAYPPLVPHRMWDRQARAACRLCDVLIVHTTNLRDDLSAFLGKAHPPIEVVPHGVWTVPALQAAPPIQERLNWKRLLFFGTIRRNKGLELLFKASELLPGFSLSIVGAPREAEYFRAEVMPAIERLRASGGTVDLIDQFIPEQQIGPLFAGHSAIVLPYTEDFRAQSGVVFLALAHELPVVASEAGGLRELFDQFRIGSSFRQATPAALAAAVRSLYEPLAGPRITEQIRLAREKFSWHAAAEATIAAYAAHRDCRNPSIDPATERVVTVHGRLDDCAIATTSAH